MATGGELVLEPFCFQDQVTVSLFASVIFATKSKLVPTAIELPVAEGVCVQEGGEFFTTVQVRKVVPDELVTSARRIFDPALSSLEETFLEVPVPVSSAPFSDQLTRQAVTLAVTEKAFVAPLLAIRTLATFGDFPERLHSSPTLACQEQSTESRPSETLASMFFTPCKLPEAVKSAWLAVALVMTSTKALFAKPSRDQAKPKVSPVSAAPLTVKD